METRDAHIKSHQKLAAHYHAACYRLPFLEPAYYHHLAKSLLQKNIIRILQPILQTDTQDWKELCLICKKHPTPNELNQSLNQITFLDINCGAGMLLTAFMRVWIQAKSELSLLFFPDGRRISQVTLQVEGEDLQAWDLRDNTLCEYYAPNPVRRVTYQHALTGKMTVVEEGKIKSETQLLQEAIFEEKKRFVQAQVYGVCGDNLHVDLLEVAISLELAKHLYYTLESDYHNLVDLPDITLNFAFANALQSRFPADMAWADFGKKEKDWENLLLLRQKQRAIKEERKQKILQKQITDLRKKILEAAIKHDERFELCQKLQATFHQKYELNTLFEVETAYKTSHEKADLQAEITKLEKVLGLRKGEILPLDWALTFPELADEKGIFKGADVVFSDIRPEILPNLPKNSQKFVWKNEVYHRFCEQILLKCLKANAYVAMILPATFLQKSDATEIRKHLLQNMNCLEIGEMNVEYLYLIAEKNTATPFDIIIKNAFTGEKKYDIGKKYILPEKNYFIDTHLSVENQAFLHEIEKDCFWLQNTAEMVKGIAISQKNMTTNDGIKLLKAKDISPLHIHFQQRYMSPDYPEFVQRQAEFAGENWVYVSYTAGKMVASISDSTFLFSKEMYGISLHSTISKYYLAAWLNSATYQRYIALKWGNVTSQNLINILENTPLKQLKIEILTQIETLVKKIIDLQNGGELVAEEWKELDVFWE